MSTKIEIPEGWSTKDFGVELRPGKPEDATVWQDVKGRPVVKTGSTWTLQRQKPAPPRKVSTGPQGDTTERSKPAPPRKVTPSPQGDAPSRPKPAPPKRLAPSTPQPPKEISPEEQKIYSGFSSLAKEKLAEGTRKSYYPDPEQAAKDEGNRKRRYAPYAALSEDQLSSISAYTSQWDLNMNSLLRTGEMDRSAGQRLGNKPTPSETQVRKAIGDLTSALEQLPPAPKGTFSRAVSGHVWDDNAPTGRSASPFMKSLHALGEGDVIEDPGFSSFTAGGAPVVDRFLKGDPNSDQNILFEVESDQMRDISPISQYENEREHMLPPGAKFKVVGKREGWSRNAGTHTVIKLQQIT